MQWAAGCRGSRRSPLVLLAASTAAFVHSVPRRPLRCAASGSDKFFSSGGGDSSKDEEIARLRRENERLRRDLEGGGPTKGLFAPLRRLFGGKKELTPAERQKEELDSEIDRAFSGTGLLGGLIGSVAKGVTGMLAKSFAETSEDVVRVQREAVAALEDRLGTGVTMEAPVQQSYSSSSVNGVVTKNIQIAFRAAGSKDSGLVQVYASIDSRGNVDIIDLSFDDEDTRPGGGGGGSKRALPRKSWRDSGTVIDV